MIKPNGPSGFGYGSTAEDVTEGLSLNGKAYLLTGCNSGLGFETLRVLTLRGAHVIAAARTLEKARAACASVKGLTTPVACELAEPASVRASVATVKALNVPIDGIICNAGIMALPKLNQAYGYELQFFTNHIGHFMLVTGLFGTLATDARVTVLSSRAHESAPKSGFSFSSPFRKARRRNAMSRQIRPSRLYPASILPIATSPSHAPMLKTRYSPSGFGMFPRRSQWLYDICLEGHCNHTRVT